MVRAFTKLDELEKELKNDDNKGKLYVIDFFATWCGPCQRISPQIESWSTGDFKDKAIFLKVDVDASEAITEKYEVTSMPTFVLIKDGEEIDRVVGSDPSKLKTAIEKHAK